MRKVTLLTAMVSFTLVMGACGGNEEKEAASKEKSDQEKVCDCIRLSEEMMDIEDMDEMKAFAEEHDSEYKACEELGKKLGNEEAEKMTKSCK